MNTSKLIAQPVFFLLTSEKGKIKKKNLVETNDDLTEHHPLGK